MIMAPAKILVVDDDPAIRNLIHRFLTKQNYQMESAEDGKTAMAVFEQFNPDLVILDVNLPDANGYNLCKEMQERTGVFVLMLTSRTDEADKIRGFSQTLRVRRSRQKEQQTDRSTHSSAMYWRYPGKQSCWCAAGPD